MHHHFHGKEENAQSIGESAEAKQSTEVNQSAEVNQSRHQSAEVTEARVTEARVTEL